MVSRSVKICLLGDYAVGKTSLVRRFVYNLFEDKYLSTIGVKVSRKVVAVPRGDDVVELVLMLWDLAGSEEFDSVRASYLRGAAAGLIVCDATEPATLQTAPDYVAGFRAANPRAAIVLVANKQDVVEQRRLSEEDIAKAATELSVAYACTSAKTGAGVEEAFRYLGRLALET